MTADLPPDSATLRRFLLGDLPPAELEAVGRYLDAHPHVASTLAGLKPDDTLLSALRGPAEASDPPDVAAAVARAAGLVGGEPITRSLPPTPSAVETADPDAADDDPFAALAPAEADGELGRLGGYRVLRLLGKGGMGAVFEAADDRLGRRVALKVMLPALAAKPSARQRFLREAKAAAAVEHDHIVPIYQTGEDRGVPFLAMPLLAGEPLDDRLKGDRALAVADVLRIGREVAEGLAAAHAAGLVHRDIKPSNVWLERTADGAFKRTRILDFGLARTATGADGLTASGTVLGTPAYMAPEQARGETVDARADLFSLGCVVYHAATGRRPFPGSDTFSVLTALATTAPAPAAEVNPAVPPGLSHLIARLLTKDPAGRPATARAVADEMARLAAEPVRDSITHVAGAGPAGRPGGDTTEAFEPIPPRPARRRRWRVAAAVLFAGVVGLAAANGPTIVRVATNQGELVVEVADPATEVVVKGGAAELRREEGGKKRVYLVAATKDGEVEVREPGSDAVLVMEKFQLRRGGDVLVKVTADRLAAARGAKAGGAQPKAAGPPPAAPTPRNGPAVEPTASPNPHVRLAEWVFAQGGSVRFVGPGHETERSRLPDGPPDQLRILGIKMDLPAGNKAAGFAAAVKGVEFSAMWAGGAGLTDDHLAAVARDGPPLGFLLVADSAVTEKGLSHLPALPLLHHLAINRTPVTAAGLAHVGRCRQVTQLGFLKCGLTDAGLAGLEKLDPEQLDFTAEPGVTGDGLKHIAGMKRLNRLSFVESGVGDAGLAHLAGLAALRELDLRQSKVTEAGVRRLAAALPACTIHWDGGTIEPRPRPTLPADADPPAVDAFPGRLVFYNRFQDAKTAGFFQGTRDGTHAAVRGGEYRLTTAVGKAGQPLVATFGTAAPDVAFVARTKVDAGVTQFTFRVRTTDARGNWLLVRVSEAGRWSVVRVDMTATGGTRADKLTVLAEGTTDDPALAAGRWVNVAGRAVGKDYEVWVNGKSVARGTDDPAFDGPSTFPAAFQAAVVGAADGPLGLTVDHAAAWAPTPPRAP